MQQKNLSAWLIMRGEGGTAELALSLDLIYHLVEDEVFHAHMENIFDAATRMVVVYSSNDRYIEESAVHVRHRVFTDWVSAQRPRWTQTGFVKNKYPRAINGDRQNDDGETSFADFFIFES